MDDAILDPFLKLLADLSSEPVIRSAEIAGDNPVLWDALKGSGFLDALVAEDKGGVGLPPDSVAALAIACGEHLVPAPVAETMVARAILAQYGFAGLCDGPIVLWPQSDDGTLRSQVPPQYHQGGFAMTQSGDLLQLMEVSAADRDAFHLLPAALDSNMKPLISIKTTDVNLMAWTGAILSANMAGAMNAVLKISIEHVNTRAQFGRPLSKFQVIQHNIALMAEMAASANVAANFGFMNETLAINPWRAAVAKCLVSEAAGRTCAIAHAVHGAIGISEEHKLQLFTRRLKRWQLSFGSEGFWSRQVAAPWLEVGSGTSLDIIREQSGIRRTKVAQAS